MQLAKVKEANNRLEEENNGDRLKLEQVRLEGAHLRSQIIEVSPTGHSAASGIPKHPKMGGQPIV